MEMMLDPENYTVLIKSFLTNIDSTELCNSAWIT